MKSRKDEGQPRTVSVVSHNVKGFELDKEMNDIASKVGEADE